MTLVIVLIGSAYVYAEEGFATYEQIINGDCNGRTVTVRAIACRSYYRELPYRWAVQKADGSYEEVSLTESRWCLSKHDYDNANPTVKEAIDNREPLTLEVNFSPSGLVYISKVYASNYIREEYFNSETIPLFVGMIGFLVLLVIVATLYDHSKRGKTARLMRSGTPIKTKIVDSSHTVYTQGKNTNIPIDKTTFLIYLDNGMTTFETVSNGSYAYKRYMRLLDVGD